jgi:hypothetical protein
MRVEGVEGCSDGGCVWGHPGGMHTNGGCKCLYYAAPKLDDRRRIEKNIRALRARVAELEAERDRYHELLYAVEKKHPGETRHETALRYIRQAEVHTEDAAQEVLR